MPQVEIRSRMVGTGSPQECPPELVLEFPNDHILVRELIAYTLEEQLYDLMDNYQLEVFHALRVVQGQYLSSDEMDAQLAPGNRSMPGRTLEINLDAEFEKAWSAFEQGVFLVIVDGLPVEALDEVIQFQPSSRVTIMRPSSLI
jgi:hypothetical protein